MPIASPRAARFSASGLPPGTGTGRDELHPVLEDARSTAAARAPGYAGDITPQEAWALHRAGGALLIDVRTEEELQTVGRVANALHLPWLAGERMERNPQFLPRLAELAAHRDPVLLLCRSGKRSVAAARAAAEAGFSLVFNVLEGFEGDANLPHPNGWQQRGLPWIQD